MNKFSPEQLAERRLQLQILELAGLVIRHPRPDGSADLEFPRPDHPAITAYENSPCSQDEFIRALGPLVRHAIEQYAVRALLQALDDVRAAAPSTVDRHNVSHATHVIIGDHDPELRDAVTKTLLPEPRIN